MRPLAWFFFFFLYFFGLISSRCVCCPVPPFFFVFPPFGLQSSSAQYQFSSVFHFPFPSVRVCGGVSFRLCTFSFVFFFCLFCVFHSVSVSFSFFSIVRNRAAVARSSICHDRVLLFFFPVCSLHHYRFPVFRCTATQNSPIPARRHRRLLCHSHCSRCGAPLLVSYQQRCYIPRAVCTGFAPRTCAVVGAWRKALRSPSASRASHTDRPTDPTLLVRSFVRSLARVCLPACHCAPALFSASCFLLPLSFLRHLIMFLSSPVIVCCCSLFPLSPRHH